MSAVLRESRAIETLQHYLRAWARRCRAWRPSELGYKNKTSIVNLMVPAVAWSSTEDEQAEMDESEDQISSHVMTSLDAEVESLPTMLRAALKLHYLNEMGPDVWRHNRMSKSEVLHLSARAESAMIPGLLRRGVVLD